MRRRRLWLLALVLFLAAAAAFWMLSRRWSVPPGAAEAVPSVVSSSVPGRRVLFVGLDGADWQLLDRYLAAGMMPRLAALVSEGRRGVLESERPPLSPLLWTTMMTGASPLEHRVLDFTRFHPMSGRQEPMTSNERRVPAIWNLATYGGREVAIMGLWATYPAEPVRGLMVSDRLFSFFHHRSELPPGVVYPPGREAWARRVLAEAEEAVDLEAMRRFLPWLGDEEYRRLGFSEDPYGHPVSALRRILVETEVYHRLALEHLTDHDPDLAVLYIQGTDTVGHTFAPYAPPRQPTISEQDYERYRQVPELYFRWVDELLGQYRRLAAERQAVLFLASDHGFEWGEGRPATVSSYDMETAAQWHRQQGIYLLAGPGIEAAEAVGRGGLRQVAATLLALLGLPRGQGVAGPPLAGVPATAAAELDYRAHYRRPEEPVEQPLAGNEEELAKLRALGYLGADDGGGRRAAEAARKAGLDPTRTAGSYNNEGVLLKSQHRFDEAEEAFRKALVLEPRRSGVYGNLANLALEQGFPDQAAEHLRAGLRLTPDRADLHLELARTLARAGRVQEAEEHLGSCAAGQGSAAAPCRRALAAGGLEALAEEAAGTTGAADPRDVERELQALCRSVTRGANPYFGRSQVDALRQRLARAPDDPEIRVQLLAQLSAQLLRLGEEEEAVSLLAQALQMAASRNLEVRLQLQLLTDLGVAYLRLGETLHLRRPGGYSPLEDLQPFAPTGPASEALRAFRGVLAGVPDHPTVDWLARVAAIRAGELAEIPALAASAAGGGLPRFPDVAAPAGLSIVGGGGSVVADDFDGDGWIDLIVSFFDPCRPLLFYRNDGRGGFQDLSRASALDTQLGGANLIQGDHDGDGDLDLLVLRGAWLGDEGRMRNSLLRNDGDGSFSDITEAAGLAWPAYPTQTAAWADFDLDGDLDLYVGNESIAIEGATGRGRAAPSQLFRNNGEGTFTDIAAAAGVGNNRSAKGVAWGDFDNDGDPDLAVANFGGDRLYRNNGDGTFTDLSPQIGLDPEARNSLAVAWLDANNDGRLDLLITDFGAGLDQVAASLLGVRVAEGRPRLYLNAGGARFEEAGEEAGFIDPVLATGADLGDLDNDGRLDLYLTTGLPAFEAQMPNRMYLGEGAAGFRDATRAGGFGFLQKAHGAALADFDNDGDLDIFTRLGGVLPGDVSASPLQENPGADGSWIGLRLEGSGGNRSAIGARVTVTVESPKGRRSIHRQVGRSSHGGSPLGLHLGLGELPGDGRIAEVEILWPGSGLSRRFGDVEPGRTYSASESRASLVPLELAPARLGGRRR